MTIFKLPDLGEGLVEATIMQWYVSVGDSVELDTPLLSVETAKAIVEVPSPYRGTIVKLFGVNGAVIPTGSALVEFKVSEQRVDTGTVAGSIEVGTKIISEEVLSVPFKASSTQVKASPAVRALAKELSVDLEKIVGTGAQGTISIADVRQKAGEGIVLTGVRRAMAQAMVHSHKEVVPVSLFDEADVSHWTAETDMSTAMMLAIISAAKQEPALNAWYDGTTMRRTLLSSVHIGIAVDTPEGLFVPVIHEAEKLDPLALRTNLNTLREQVQSRKVALKDLEGASIILSNFGKFSGKYANAIVVPPMVAILAVGRKHEMVMPIDGEIKIRQILPLSLSFDHRAVTGGEATRFMAALQKALSAPL